ncbi:MAG: ATP-binding cassette domain-containing protein, partial [Nocardioidaceae bacterium]
RQGRQPWRWRSRDLAARLAWTPQVAEAGMVASSVRDEVLASGRATGRDLKWLEPRVDGLIESFGLSALADVSPHHLSGGEQRRLMVAAALAHGPAAALFDEPTVGQDRLTWSVVVSALDGAAAAGSGVCLATHDSDAVELLGGDRLTLASRGAERP